jgi:type VI secretion system VasD/TssJ family lipoprotein
LLQRSQQGYTRPARSEQPGSLTPPSRWRRAAGAGPGLALLLALATACGGAKMPAPREVCLEVQASPNLNLFDGQAHAVTIFLYPLVSPLGFQQASVQDLLDGASPPGVAAPRVSITVGPGEQLPFQEAFPQTAIYMGIVVDYYRGPNDPEGSRRAVVPATCGWFSSPTITLSPQDLLVKN